jgi:hypothetical protein
MLFMSYQTITVTPSFHTHALRLTFVRDFADEYCPRTGGYAPEVCPIFIRNLSDCRPIFYGR